MQPNCWYQGDAFNVNKAIGADDELSKCNNYVISIIVDEVAPQNYRLLMNVISHLRFCCNSLQIFAFNVHFADHRF